MASVTQAARAIAVVGPYQSGKTSLVESMLQLSGALHRKGEGGRKAFGDHAPEAKLFEMGTELNAGSCRFLDETYWFLDCPGSIELMQETLNVLKGADAAVIVIGPETERVQALAPLFRILEAERIPRLVFVNKIDRASGSVRALKQALQEISSIPLVLRHLPLREDGQITGFVDLAAERAYLYNREGGSERIENPGDTDSRIAEARYQLLETLADFDDHLMEELLEDINPPSQEIFEDMARDVREALVLPVLLGSAQTGAGVFRLLKALRHETPGVEAARMRRGIGTHGALVGQVIKTLHTPHGGKVSLTRIFDGVLKETDLVNGGRTGGLAEMRDQELVKIPSAAAGDLAAILRAEHLATGDTVDGTKMTLERAAPLEPVFSLALTVENRQDEVKLSSALQRLAEEDISYSFEHDEDTHEFLLRGQGEVHLRIAVEKLKSKYGIAAGTHRPHVSYRETIRKGKEHHARFRKQSGGHGQFADIVIDVMPNPAGLGFSFEERIHGGAIPRQYIPSVEDGVRDGLAKGPLGFPVVDVGVVLKDGKFHSVDSSDMAFQICGKIAMAEALPDCSPILLEPIQHVEIYTPASATSAVTAIISGRRGQILGFDARSGWPGWDRIEVQIPAADMHDLIIELRSVTQGAGSYASRFSHLQELSGRAAEQVLKESKAARSSP